MLTSIDNKAIEKAVSERELSLFDAQKQDVYKRTDKLFGQLLLIEWIAGIVLSQFFSPRAWAGSESEIHIHVWTAIFLGAAIIARPIYLIAKKPGDELTRHTVAVAQMLYSALLIHLTGGRIESHFHVFGSLAFLSMYRDWRVLISASLVVVADHILRGIYYPMSIYGVKSIEPLRWLEHAWWVVFEDVFLIKCCIDNVKEMKAIALRQAEVELTREHIEDLVTIRTAELASSEKRLATQYAVTRSLTEASTMSDAASNILDAIYNGVLADKGLVASLFWTVDRETGKLQKVMHQKYSAQQAGSRKVLTASEIVALRAPVLAERAVESNDVLTSKNLKQKIILRDHIGEVEHKMTNAVVIPLSEENVVLGAIEFFCAEPLNLTEVDRSMIKSLGQQIGEFASKVQIQSANVQLANIVQWSGDAIIGQTADGYITSWNSGAQSHFGYTAEEMAGKHISILVPAAKADELKQLISANQYGNRIEGLETQRLRSDGQVIEVLVTRSPVYDDRSRLIGVSEVMHNINDRKEAERRVSEFYSIVSHELRTPLTSVRGALGLIENGVVEGGSEEATGLVTVARESTDRLIRLINDMLDLKKIESGKMELHIRQMSVESLVGDCLKSLNAIAEEAGLKLVADLKFKGQIMADHDKATQILTNLVSNAVKFSPAGESIRVEVDCRGDNRVRFNIIDNGPGISPKNQSKLFGKFQQLDASDNREKGGSGLGLAISKALVEQHGGTIGLDSAPGQGSTFWFEMPLVESGVRKSDELSHGPIYNPLYSPPHPNEKQILLVEDDEPLAKILITHFKQTGYQTLWANCICEAQKFLASHLPEAMVLDLSLPDGSGLDLLEEIKSNPDTASLPVIVITGQTIENKYVANATVADWLPKPFNTADLVKVLDRVTTCSEPETFLIADEDTGVRRAIGSQMAARGMLDVEQQNADEFGIGHVLADSEHLNPPDLILFDVSNSEQARLETMKSLRRRDHSLFPVVIFLSQETGDGEKGTVNMGKASVLREDEETQAELIEALSKLLGGICK